ncbi:phenylalanine--tRNA ligase beta subunit [Tepiditoga spiralis]|uniref:Phenylalanine--tRNA ligase beta subunit n=1 Tax=Tepiditoga spiralis TaxID=2108365 RepID=A0A7G1G1S1_9BACT|nr:phenylalanine--tRNA ligase subunit beta [Tepiditoga spiralis]BBE30098.1 phenylalanine--tRNA ligase beta subunit [Tepiditoga spiralis]
MRLSMEWISDYIKLKEDETGIVNKIKQHTTNVETVDEIAKGVKKVKVGKILKTEGHPDADRLQVCTVDVGEEEPIIIVTNDLSIKPGHTVPVAVDGAVLKDNFKIKSRKMRGVFSQGMFCSLEEFELEENAHGVYKINEDVKPGTDFLEYFKINDKVIEIEVFANRPDLLSYVGVAKELETINAGTDFKLPEYTKLEKTDVFPIKLETTDCNRYTAAIMTDIKIGPSPIWLVRRLASAGIRSINNIVDITNYVMLETGHPVHAFDMDLIGNQIVVKKGEKGTKVLLLDEKKYELNGTETLITDGEKILALGGVMGGELSGINENTKRILLEVAHFDPVNTRKTSKYHKLQTDASFRFERGVDPNDAEFVMGRLVKLISELANGKSDGKMVDVYPNIIEPKTIKARYEYIKDRLGVEISKEEVEKIYDSFEFKYQTTEFGWVVTVPTNRHDLSIEIDIVEEVGRIYGYHNIESSFPETVMKAGTKGAVVSFKDEVSNIVRSTGYNEIMTYSFMNIEKMWMEKSEIKLLNPLSAEYEYMRPLVSYGVLESISYNFRNQNRDVKFFEIANVYSKDESLESKIKETLHLSIGATGRENPDDFTDKREVSYYTLKGAVDTLFKELNIIPEYKRVEIEGMSYSQTAEIFVDKEKVGFIGLVDKDYAKKFYGIKAPVYIGELDLSKLFELKVPLTKENKNYEYPAIKREYSFIVPIKVAFSEIEEIINKSGKIIEKISIFDIYKGKNMDEDKISITITITYRASDRTLTDEDVNRVENKMLKKLNNIEVSLRER